MKTKVLIGSAAVELNHPGLLQREPKDRDYLSLEAPRSQEDVIDGANILDRWPFEAVASVSEVLTLKISHSFWLIDWGSWHKHLRDIHVMQQEYSYHPELYRIAYAEWERRKGKKEINLAQDKELFFDNRVKRTYDHDSLHACLAFGDNPLYSRILRANEEVLTSQEKFDELSFKDKCQLVEEEVSVLALERELIPKAQARGFTPATFKLCHFEKIDLYQAYARQLQRLIIQYSKGYFPLWIVQNYFSVFKPTRNYWHIFTEDALGQLELAE